MPTDDLQFDRATYEGGQGAELVCSMCKKPIEGQYWQWLGRVLCGSCRQGVSVLEAQAKAPATFVRAAILGTLTAFGCGVGYAIFVGVTHAQFALITIGIAYVVATVLRKATRNVSGRRYQVLAAVLTYMAGTMGYAPTLYRTMVDGDASHETRSATTPAYQEDEPAEPPPPHEPVTARQAFTAVGFVSAFMLAAPFVGRDWLGLLIIGFGVWEAWRRARPLPMEVTGPHRVPSRPLAASP